MGYERWKRHPQTILLKEYLKALKEQSDSEDKQEAFGKVIELLEKDLEDMKEPDEEMTEEFFENLEKNLNDEVFDDDSKSREASSDGSRRAEKGDRVKLLHTSDEYTNLEPGDKGTVQFVDDMGTVHIKWDNGKHLGMIPDEDTFEIIED